MEEKDIASGSVQVNPNYALFQIAKALTTSQQHEDVSTRKRAQVKIAKWTTVFNGILNGALAVGSRTPVEAVSGWATLEVITEGFATGAL